MGWKRRVSKGLYRTAALFSPYWNTQMCFLRACGHKADLKNPRTFSEKLSWLKLYRYGHDPLVKRCADKYAVRSFVEEQGCGHLLNELLSVYRHPKDIPWETLPSRFVLKWNFGCGFNLLCTDKAQLDIPAAIRQLKQWGHSAFWAEHAELQYRGVDKCILCERFLDTPSGKELLDYKFYCFHGQPMAVLVIARPEEGEKAAVFMSPQWEVLSDIPTRYKETLLPQRPVCLDEMLDAAKRLSAPFPFVRVDFYEVEDRPIFGELTFTPAAGIFPSETPIDGIPMGDLIDLGG